MEKASRVLAQMTKRDPEMKGAGKEDRSLGNEERKRSSKVALRIFPEINGRSVEKESRKLIH